MKVETKTVRWGAGPVTFELRSSDPEVVDHARRAFRVWQPETEDVLGSWTVSRQGEELTVDPRPIMPDGVEEQTVRTPVHAVATVEYAAVAKIFQDCTDLLTFHAALLSKEGRAVTIVGPSCAGKSTLSTALWRDGWHFHCDDLTMVKGLDVWPAPRRVGLRNESRALLGDPLWNRILDSDSYLPTDRGALFQPQELEPRTPENKQLSGIFFLSRLGADAEATAPTRLLPAHAAMAIFPYSNLARRFSFSEAFRPVGELMSRVPAWDLPRASLEEMVQSVNQLVLGRDGD